MVKIGLATSDPNAWCDSEGGKADNDPTIINTDISIEGKGGYLCRLEYPLGTNNTFMWVPTGGGEAYAIRYSIGTITRIFGWLQMLHYGASYTVGNWTLIDNLRMQRVDSDENVKVTAVVEMPSAGKYFKLTYIIENIGTDTITNVKFYEYVEPNANDYDFETTTYDPERNMYYSTNNEGLRKYFGVASLDLTDNRDLGTFWHDVLDRIWADTLNNFDGPYTGDTGFVLEKDIERVDPGEKIVLSVFFIVGDTLFEVQSIYDQLLQKTRATITSYSISSGEFKAGDKISAQVTIRNIGKEAWTFYVGFSVQDPNGKWWDAPYETVTLNPNEEGTVTLYWTVPSEAPAGSYNARVAVWEGKQDGKLTNLLDYRDETGAFEIVGYELVKIYYPNREYPNVVSCRYTPGNGEWTKPLLNTIGWYNEECKAGEIGVLNITEEQPVVRVEILGSGYSPPATLTCNGISKQVKLYYFVDIESGLAGEQTLIFDIEPSKLITIYTSPHTTDSPHGFLIYEIKLYFNIYNFEIKYPKMVNEDQFFEVAGVLKDYFDQPVTNQKITVTIDLWTDKPVPETLLTTSILTDDNGRFSYSYTPVRAGTLGILFSTPLGHLYTKIKVLDLENRKQLYEWYAQKLDPDYWIQFGKEVLKKYEENMIESYTNPLKLLLKVVKSAATLGYSSSEELVKQAFTVSEFVLCNMIASILYEGSSPTCPYYFGMSAKDISSRIRDTFNLIEQGKYQEARENMESIIYALNGIFSQVKDISKVDAGSSDVINYPKPNLVIKNITKAAIEFFNADIADLSPIMEFKLESAAYLTIIDPNGRCVGFDIETYDIKQEIPASLYTGLSDCQTVVIPNPLNGTYYLYLYGVENGNFTVSVVYMDVNGETINTESFKGYIHLGEVLTSIINLTAANASIQKPQRLPYSVTLNKMQLLNYIRSEVYWLSFIISNHDISKGIKRALLSLLNGSISKIDEAIKWLEIDKHTAASGNLIAAKNMMNAFKNLVEALEGKKLDEKLASSIISQSELICDDLALAITSLDA